MESINGHSKACCNIPPVVSKGYELKGKYETIGGLKTCEYILICVAHAHAYPLSIDVTGPLTATNAIFVIYDVCFPWLSMRTAIRKDHLASSS